MARSPWMNLTVPQAGRDRSRTLIEAARKECRAKTVERGSGAPFACRNGVQGAEKIGRCNKSQMKKAQIVIIVDMPLL
jgi:hypothetical protein